MRKINKIIVHCSDSSWGNAAEIDKWHKEFGWKGIGYHYVILNGNIHPRVFAEEFDGALELGRPVEEQGAHVKGMNEDTIGVCLIGIDIFSKKQKSMLNKLLYSLCREYELSRKDILGHYETPTGAAQGKTCPNINMKSYRRKLRWLFLIWAYGFYTPIIDDLISG